MYFITNISPWFFSKQSQLHPKILGKPNVSEYPLRKKARYYQDSLKKKSVYAISKYNCYKNKLTKIIKTAKRNYYICKCFKLLNQT